jgi:ADP-ribosylglycohydrolase
MQEANLMRSNFKSRVAGSFFGLALGDALGARTEFLSIPEIQDKFPPDGPHTLEGDPALVTDDTQMAICVARALVESPPGDVDSFVPALTEQFVGWLHAQDNNRAPGSTCLTACARLEAGLPYTQACRANSKGCGANMRVAPVAYRYAADQHKRSLYSQLQAAMTHGHATALAASDLTSFAVAHLLNEGSFDSLLDMLMRACETGAQTYHPELDTLWQRGGSDSAESYMALGFSECHQALTRVYKVAPNYDTRLDPCAFVGEGWIAEEALAAALLCCLSFAKDPQSALWRAATSSGDSDSIACIAGSFVGAAHGIEAWPKDWLTRIEYAEEISSLSLQLIQ